MPLWVALKETLPCCRSSSNSSFFFKTRWMHIFSFQPSAHATLSFHCEVWYVLCEHLCPYRCSSMQHLQSTEHTKTFAPGKRSIMSFLATWLSKYLFESVQLATSICLSQKIEVLDINIFIKLIKKNLTLIFLSTLWQQTYLHAL